MNLNHDYFSGAKFAFVSLASSMAGHVPQLQELTDQGQLVSVVVSILTSIIALVKLLKKKK